MRSGSRVRQSFWQAASAAGLWHFRATRRGQPWAGEWPDRSGFGLLANCGGATTANVGASRHESRTPSVVVSRRGEERVQGIQEKTRKTSDLPRFPSNYPCWSAYSGTMPSREGFGVCGGGPSEFGFAETGPLQVIAGGGDSVGVVGVQAEGVEVVLCDRDGSGSLIGILDGAVFDKGRCQMLVLSRKVGESIQIAGDIRVTVTQVRGGRVRLSIEAPPSVRIARREIVVKQLEDSICTGESEASAAVNQGSGDDLLSVVEGG
ncbi:MAG: hypothetical protein RLZZ232_1177 [Planctomycetota bacterium]|jgi:carbon storage regulator